jgi:hypothetical protein
MGSRGRGVRLRDWLELGWWLLYHRTRRVHGPREASLSLEGGRRPIPVRRT